jgi:hypothetical protein
VKRVRVTMTVEADPDAFLFRWLLAHIVDMHQTAPGRVQFKVEVLKDR